MPNLNWHDSLLLASFFACIIGLFLLSDTKQSQLDDQEGTQQALFSMSFAYWMVYCITTGILKLNTIEWENVLLSLKLTAIISYFLTFSCILSLPLHRMSVRQVE